MSSITHKLSLHCVDKLCRYVETSELNHTKMVLGMESFLINISKLTVIFAASIALGVFTDTLVMMVGFALIKVWAFGLHAKSSIVCTLTSVYFFVGVPYMLQGIEIGNAVVCVVFLCIVILLYKYAPADTEARPLVGIKKRHKLKMKAVATGLGVMLLALIVPNRNIAFLLTLGAIFETVSILPVTYWVLKRKERNYEAYE